MSSRRPRRTGFHTIAWVAWLLSSVLVVNALESPLAVPIVFGALAAVAGVFAVSGPESRSFATLLKIGLAFTVVRVLLFAATGHTGETTLFTTPEARLPRWLGDLRIGGRVTAEVVLQSGLEGLRLAAFLACFGAFLAVTDVYRVLRLLPRFLAEAGLVLTIALAFTPTMFRAAGEIRDAQRLRGHRVRGLRGVLPLALPVLSTGLERSVTLAESMDVRGYGRRIHGFERVEAWARAGILLGMLALSAGGALYLFDRGPFAASIVVLAAGALALTAGLAALSRATPRTRMRRERWVAWDWALSAGAVAAAAAAITFRAVAPDATRYYPYPEAFWPPFHLGVVVVASVIALPAFVGAARTIRLGRAEARHPQQAAPIAAGAPR